MGKFVPLMMGLLIFIFAITIFLGVDPPVGDVFASFMNWQSWDSVGFWDWIQVIVAAVSIGALVSISTLMTGREFPMFIALSAGILAFLPQYIIRIAQHINGEYNWGVEGVMSNILVAAIVAPILLFVVFLVLEWARGRD